MSTSRRRFLATSASIPLVLWGADAFAQAATTLKISHQFPGGSGDQGDFRDVLCRKFAAEIEKRTKVGTHRHSLPARQSGPGPFRISRPHAAPGGSGWWSSGRAATAPSPRGRPGTGQRRVRRSPAPGNRTP